MSVGKIAEWVDTADGGPARELDTAQGGTGLSATNARDLLEQLQATDTCGPTIGIVSLPHGTTFDSIGCGSPTLVTNSAAASLVDGDGTYVALDTTTVTGNIAGVETATLCSRETWPELIFDGRSAIINSVFCMGVATANPLPATTGAGTPLFSAPATAGVSSVTIDGWSTPPAAGDVLCFINTGGGNIDTTEYTVASAVIVSGDDYTVTFSPVLAESRANNDVVRLIRRKLSVSNIPAACLYYNTQTGDNLYKLLVSAGQAISLSYSNDVYVNASGSLITVGNNWRSAGVREGMLLTIGGTTSNNGTHRVVSVNATGKQIVCSPVLTQEATSGTPIVGPVTITGGGEALTTTTIPVSANARFRYRLRYTGSYTWEASSYNATTHSWENVSTSAGVLTPAASTSTDTGDILKAWWQLKQVVSTARTTAPRSILARNMR